MSFKFEYRRGASPRLGLVTFFGFVFMLGTPSFAATPADDAHAWLLDQQQVDGSFHAATGLATPEQATAEALLALAVTGSTRDAGLAFLGAMPVEDQPTEYLARLLRAAGPTATAVLAELQQRQNADGGFATYRRMPSTVLDTAHALTALAETDATASRKAVDFLLSTRTGNGWASTSGVSDAALTLQAWHALFPLRHSDDRVPAVLDAALAELESPAAEHFIEAQRLLALMLRSTGPSSYSAALQDFLASRSPNGSWSNDVYSTALALRVLTAASDSFPNPDLAGVHGVLLDGERDSALPGVTLMFSGTAARSIVTDASGRFAVAGLPAGHYVIDADVPGYTSLTAELELAHGENIDLGAMRLFTLADPSLAVLAGHVLAATGEPLAGTRIALAGPATAVATSGADGSFYAGGLAPGAYTATVSHDGYMPLQRTVMLQAGRTTFIDARLDAEPVREFHLAGRILHGETGMPLQDVSVVVTGDATAAFTTDASGAYAGTVTGAGVVQLAAALDGFDAVAVTRVATGGTAIDFSPGLFPVGSDDPRAQRGGLRGRVVDALTGVPVADASLQLTGASNAATTISDTNGLFEFDLQAAENSVLATSHEGHQQDMRMAVPVAGIVLDLGDIALLPASGNYPVHIGGTIVDSITGEPLAGVTVHVSQQDAAWQVVSGADGTFMFEANRILAASVTFSRQDYLGETVGIVPHLSGENLGRIRLRPESADAPLPDLSIGAVTTGGGFSDPFSFDATGVLRVSVLNRGSQAVTTPVDIVAYVDSDGDGLFASGVDVEHGRAMLGTGIQPGSNVDVGLPLHGMLMFRDAPVHIAVDPANHVVEQSESNNTSSTMTACRVQPETGAFNPVKKYQALRGAKIIATPMVANLTDDNGDGLINSDDVPDIAVPVFDGRGQFDGASIIIIDGATGQMHHRTEGTRLVSALNDIAIADIDADGFPEIVAAYNDGNHLIAFEHDGSRKWLSDYDPLPGRRDAGGSISIADLDADGIPEIVTGASVYDANGHLLADGRDLGGTIGYKLYTSISAIADVDLDGRPEIIAGPTSYEFQGGALRIDWRRPDLEDGFVGIANFDEDEFAEIVLVAPGKVHVLNHDGSDLGSWAAGTAGAALVPGGGYSGPPTIADVDGDGAVEVGVAGASFYAVFNSDGSILWQSPIQDASSQVTGSTSFDFEGDGTAEIVYRDEMALRIYRGSDGVVLYSSPLRSGTATELPVIADVDADGHAEIVIVGDDRFGGAIDDTGVHVFEDAADSWIDTRSIWNQHSYHITNINDDGSVPADEQPSWLSHNTYRLNAFPDRNPLAAADLAVGRLEIIDAGPGMPIRLRVRIGNAGAASSQNGTLVSFHDGDASTAPLLGSISLPTMAPGDWQDFELAVDGITGLQGVIAIVDTGTNNADCSIANNSVWQQGLPTVGMVAVMTDAASYAPAQDALLTAVVDNSGTFARAFKVQLGIEDSNGNIVAAFPVQDLGELASGEQRIIQENWNTAHYLAGDYRLRATLRAAGVEPLASATAPFGIRHDATGSPLAALRLATDRARYHTSDQVRFDLLAQNLSVSTLLNASSVRLTVTDPAGSVVFEHTPGVRELAAGNADTLFATQLLDRAATGDYQVTSVWRAADGTVLAADQRSFEVHEDLALALRGSVTTASPQVYIGDAQLCTETASNTGTLTATVPLRHTLARLDAPGATTAEPFSATLDPGASQAWLRGVETTGMSAGDYACVLEAQINGAWQPLGNAFFRLVPPPIRVDASMSAGQRGRLLVLLDPACADLDPPEGEGGVCDADPYGPGIAPPLPIQRTHLEAVLDAAGWTYTIVTDADSFATEFSSKGYALYALFHEQVKLPEALQRDVVNDIASGRGLLVAGNHDRRNGRLEDALGIRSLGRNIEVEALVVEPFGDYAGGELAFGIAHRPNAISTDGAEVLGEFRVPQQGNKPPALEPSLTRHAHVNGTGVYASFDWPAQSATQGDDSGLAGLLTATLDIAHPAPYAPIAGRVFALHVTLQNEGMATLGEVRMQLPPGVVLIEGPGTAVVMNGVVSWPFTLAEGQQRTDTLWLRMPATAGALALEAVIYTGEGDGLAEHASTQTVLNVQPQEQEQ